MESGATSTNRLKPERGVRKLSWYAGSRTPSGSPLPSATTNIGKSIAPTGQVVPEVVHAIHLNQWVEPEILKEPEY